MRKEFMYLLLVALVTVGVLYASTDVPKKVVSSTTEVKSVNYKEENSSPAASAQKVKHIRQLTLKSKNTLTLFEEVTGVNSDKIAFRIREMNQENSNEPIVLLLDSPGGSVIAGSKIISAIEASRRPVYTVCVTLCASMAAMIHSYGNIRMSVDRSILMFHNASGGAQGEVPRMLSLLHTLDRYIKKMDNNVITRSKLDSKHYYELVQNELWIDGEDALEMGLTDELVSLSPGDVKYNEGSFLEERRGNHTTFTIEL